MTIFSPYVQYGTVTGDESVQCYGKVMWVGGCGFVGVCVWVQYDTPTLPAHAPALLGGCCVMWMSV